MELTRVQFDILSHVEEFGARPYPRRALADVLLISAAALSAGLSSLLSLGLLAARGGDVLAVTEAGLSALEPYRVQRAVFFAAGVGSRMHPVTLETPKPLVEVNGTRIIDRLIDAMLAKGISDITIVRGYLSEKFDVLLGKYPSISFIENPRYQGENNITSALAAGEKIDRCYICAGDLLLSDPSLIKKYHYRSNYLASYAVETDDWCFDFHRGFAKNYRKGGEHCFNQYEITYWDARDSARLRADWQRAYAREGGRDLFWEFIPLVLYKDCYKVEIRPCPRGAVTEIDSLAELAAIDPRYAGLL